MLFISVIYKQLTPWQYVFCRYCESYESYKFELYESELNCPIQQNAAKQVHIRKIEVLLNGSPIDQVEDKQNEDECYICDRKIYTIFFWSPSIGKIEESDIGLS